MKQKRIPLQTMSITPARRIRSVAHECDKKKGIEERVIIQSFDFRTLRIIHNKYPGIKTAALIEEGDHKTF
jgi:glycerophosphoryl diester phosphodiesterase